MQQSLNKNADIVLACIEERFYKHEIMLENHSFVRIISGEMKVVQADNSYIFGAGDSLLFPRNQLATIIKYPKNGRPYKSVLMTLTTARLKEYYTKSGIISAHPHAYKMRIFPKHPLLESFFASLLPYFDLSDELPEKIVSLKLEEAIQILRTIDPEIDSLLANFEAPGKINLAEFIENNYMFNMPLDKFGFLTGRSLTTFKRDFKKAFNTTPQKWLTKKRLELAHYQFTQKDRKPTEVYLEVGFENLSHFSFAFKKHFGYSPRQLMEQVKASS
jgi:AraC-like DNA-binding protein